MDREREAGVRSTQQGCAGRPLDRSQLQRNEAAAQGVADQVGLDMQVQTGLLPPKVETVRAVPQLDTLRRRRQPLAGLSLDARRD
jgi:hypothetical protein